MGRTNGAVLEGPEIVAFKITGFAHLYTMPFLGNAAFGRLLLNVRSDRETDDRAHGLFRKLG
jgi:hypothetical protein